MPMFHSIVRHLNRQFDPDMIEDFAQNVGAFASGQELDVGVLQFPDAALAQLFQNYINNLPNSFREVLRCLFSQALSASPPVPMSFSWAPAYCCEMTIWEPECGILVQFRGPIPGSAETS